MSMIHVVVLSYGVGSKSFEILGAHTDHDYAESCVKEEKAKLEKYRMILLEIEKLISLWENNNPKESFENLEAFAEEEKNRLYKLFEINQSRVPDMDLLNGDYAFEIRSTRLITSPC